MNKHHAIEHLTPTMTFGAATGLMVWTRFREMWKHRAGTVEGDVEALHDMRVGSRRLRAALDMAALAHDDQERQAFRRLTARLTAELGAVRDTDVLLDSLRGLGQETGDQARLVVAALSRLEEARRTINRAALLAFFTHLDDQGYAAMAARLWKG